MELNINECIKILEEKYEVEFKYNSYLETYIATPEKGLKLDLCISHYNTDDERHGVPFIGAGWDRKERGGGRPCDSYQEVIEYFEPHLKKRISTQLSLFD